MQPYDVYKFVSRKITFIPSLGLTSRSVYHQATHTRTKRPWLVLSGNTPAKTGGYIVKEIWSEESLQRKADLTNRK